MNIVIFGTGWYADEILMSQKILDKYGWKISGFLDNNEKKWGGKIRKFTYLSAFRNRKSSVRCYFDCINRTVLRRCLCTIN